MVADVSLNGVALGFMSNQFLRRYEYDITTAAVSAGNNTPQTYFLLNFTLHSILHGVRPHVPPPHNVCGVTRARCLYGQAAVVSADASLVIFPERLLRGTELC
jgi:hypothetical protein